jgi:hypothetical protein
MDASSPQSSTGTTFITPESDTNHNPNPIGDILGLQKVLRSVNGDEWTDGQRV